MMSFEWAKPVATELLVIRMSRPFATKPAANRVMIKSFYMVLIRYSLQTEDAVHIQEIGLRSQRILYCV